MIFPVAFITPPPTAVTVGRAFASTSETPIARMPTPMESEPAEPTLVPRAFTKIVLPPVTSPSD